MAAIFSEVNPIQPETQMGVNVVIDYDSPHEDIDFSGSKATLNVWCDNEEGNTILRTTLNNSADSLLLVIVEKADFKQPSVTYSDDKTYCYVRFASNTLHIKLEDEGIVLDVWNDGNEHESVDTNYVFYEELQEDTSES